MKTPDYSTGTAIRFKKDGGEWYASLESAWGIDEKGNVVSARSETMTVQICFRGFGAPTQADAVASLMEQALGWRHHLKAPGRKPGKMLQHQLDLLDYFYGGEA